MNPRRPALSVRQPWAWAILHAFKDVENRSWAPRYGLDELLGCDLLIHAGQVVQDDAVEVVEAISGYTVPAQLPTGGVVGVVRLVEVHHADGCYMTCSPWAQTDCWHWVLGRARPLPQLVPCPGRLGLFWPGVEVAA